MELFRISSNWIFRALQNIAVIFLKVIRFKPSVQLVIFLYQTMQRNKNKWEGIMLHKGSGISVSKVPSFFFLKRKIHNVVLCSFCSIFHTLSPIFPNKVVRSQFGLRRGPTIYEPFLSSPFRVLGVKSLNGIDRYIIKKVLSKELRLMV